MPSIYFVKGSGLILWLCNFNHKPRQTKSVVLVLIINKLTAHRGLDNSGRDWFVLAQCSDFMLVWFQWSLHVCHCLHDSVLKYGKTKDQYGLYKSILFSTVWLLSTHMSHRSHQWLNRDSHTTVLTLLELSFMTSTNTKIQTFLQRVFTHTHAQICFI